MAETSKRFDEAAKKAQAGESVLTTPRELVGWFGASRRGSNVVRTIKKQLRKKKLTTFPDFEFGWIDNPISLKPIPRTETKKPVKATATAPDEPVAESTPQTTIGPAGFAPAEPTHRISRLEAAGREPLSVKPNDSVEKAVTLMLQHEYSQLPIMKSPSQVQGIVSWRSIGRVLHVKGNCKTVLDCSEPHHEVPESASMFDAIRLVNAYDCVLVRALNNKISGIVTAADIGKQFSELGEPFLLIGDIENALRALISESFSLPEIEACRDAADTERKIKSVDDLTFGEYLRLIEKPENWSKLKLKLDRTEVVKPLEEIRRIRNDVMHFNPDPIAQKDLDLLRQSARFYAKVLQLIK